MVSPDIQGLGLNDELLEHYRKEVGEMALGILDGKPFDSPVHEGILLTCMFSRWLRHPSAVRRPSFWHL